MSLVATLFFPFKNALLVEEEVLRRLLSMPLATRGSIATAPMDAI